MRHAQRTTRFLLAGLAMAALLAVPGAAPAHEQEPYRGDPGPGSTQFYHPPSQGPFAPWTGNLNVILGAKFMDEDGWAPVHEQAEVGILFDVRQREWPVSLAMDILVSGAEETLLVDDPDIGPAGITLTAGTAEFNFGLRKVIEWFPFFRPYIGAGVAVIAADLEGKTAGVLSEEHDAGVGTWVGGGFYWTLGRNLNVGFDFRWTSADVTLYGVETDAGGSHAAFMVGYHW